MARTFHRSTLRMTFTILLLALVFGLTSQPATASDGIENKSKEVKDADRSAARAEASRSAAPASAPSIAYAAFNGALIVQPEAKPVGTLAHVALPQIIANRTLANMPLPPRMPQASTAPLTVGEKFHYWIKSSFLSVGAYAQSAFTGLYNEALDNDEGKKDTVKNYFGDASTRAVRSFTFRATSGFFEKFAYASLLRQDPRYHRSGKRNVGGKIGYAISRVLITQGDRCGCNQFNASFLAGGVTASFIANQWERDERSTTGKALNRWATHIGFTIFGNIIKEFIGGQ